MLLILPFFFFFFLLLQELQQSLSVTANKNNLTTGKFAGL